jgi:hypothetical protein
MLFVLFVRLYLHAIPRTFLGVFHQHQYMARAHPTIYSAHLSDTSRGGLGTTDQIIQVKPSSSSPHS